MWDLEYSVLLDELKNRNPLFAVDERARQARELVSTIYESLPMECSGSACPIASRCPVSHRLDILGTRCLLEVREITERLAHYLKDIGLDNITYTDIQVAAQLTRTDVLIWRIEQLLSVQGLVVEETTVSGGRQVIRKVSNPLMAELRSLMKEQRALMDELMTSRRARLERMEREGRMERDFVRMLQQMSERAKGSVVIGEVALPESSEPNPLDGGQE
jgi:hypothetical protein